MSILGEFVQNLGSKLGAKIDDKYEKETFMEVLRSYERVSGK